MGRPVVISTTLLRPRFLNSTLCRTILIFVFLAFFHQQRLFWTYRNALSAKYSQTRFPEVPPGSWRQVAQPSSLDVHRLLKTRKDWKILGHGWEGNTFLFEGSVIKTFKPGRSPFRNCVPNAKGKGDQGARWPTEIPASLTFGHVWDGVLASASNASGGFVPVESWFMAPSSSSVPEWHLVTPFLPGGSLDSLAHKLRASNNKGFRDLDMQYRPSFNRLLRTFNTLHASGFCHDDVKPSNVFLQNSSHWLLGDLGNVRNIDHPFHSSQIWRDNHQLEDCRANDVVRALKSYLQFIRAAANDSFVFDEVFFEGKETLSRLFWWTIDDAKVMSAEELRVRSEVESPMQTARPYALVSASSYKEPSLLRRIFVSRCKRLSHAVNIALRARFSERHARFMAMTWVFGIQVSDC
ncbi:hypothetical protein CC78DRAFT_325908 [Lojkania enalia]|uniref:Protein kinase domain-containing protein n=1 Tax=Lojkania enalia TaxID=147567 RepID=A0A9P4K688_9PLEO|nr:hypothetical protein CC78DRAFT_325908 [Didymosphaeria enalia]